MWHLTSREREMAFGVVFAVRRMNFKKVKEQKNKYFCYAPTHSAVFAG